MGMTGGQSNNGSRTRKGFIRGGSFGVVSGDFGALAEWEEDDNCIEEGMVEVL
jgi:hypothetical protein